MVIGRATSVFLASWALLALPALCAAGVIGHTCDCVSESACVCQTDDGHDSGCGHESECPDDPCSIHVVRPERQNDNTAPVLLPVASITTILAVIHQPASLVLPAGIYEMPDGTKLPFPPSDLPLLV